MEEQKKATRYVHFKFAPDPTRRQPNDPFELFIPVHYIPPYDPAPDSELTLLERNCRSVHKLHACILTGIRAGFATNIDKVGVYRRMYVGSFEVEDSRTNDIKLLSIAKSNPNTRLETFVFSFPTQPVTDAQPDDESLLQLQKEQVVCAAKLFRAYGAGSGVDQFLYQPKPESYPVMFQEALTQATEVSGELIAERVNKDWEQLSQRLRAS
jgi:hypothetical protein